MPRAEMVSPETLPIDRASRATPQQGATHDDPAALVAGRDPNQVVTVYLHRDGRVADVQIDSWWREHVSPSQLQEAVLAAYQQAYERAAARLTPDTAAPKAPPNSSNSPRR